MATFQELDKKLIDTIGEIKITDDYKIRDFLELNPKYYNPNIKFLNVTRLAEVLEIKKYNINRREELRVQKDKGDKSLVFITRGAGGKMLVHLLLLPTVFMALRNEDLYLALNRAFLESLSKNKKIFLKHTSK